MTSPETFWEMYAAYYGHESVRGFQRFAGLPETGKLDDATVDMLHAPRCGVSDVQRATADAKWRKHDLAYHIAARVGGLEPSVVDHVIQQAFQAWAHVADLRFTRAAQQQGADLVLSTGKGSRAGFDGPGGTLAWAQLPAGNDQPLLMRFDLGETWTNDPTADIFLLAVAAHEFGHLLGLDHDSQGSGALMAPFYNRRTYAPQAKDIQRIQGLYGPPRHDPPPPPGRKTILTIELDGVVTGARVLRVEAT